MGTPVEQSTTATVAGEAAAAAVDEVETREELAEATQEALITSAVAEGTALESQAVASSAVETAAVAGEIASDASQRAEVASEQAQQATEVSQTALSDNQALRQEMAGVRELLTDIANRLAPAEETQSDVSEVDVNGGGSSDNGSTKRSGGAGEGAESTTDAKADRNRGLRRRNRT